MPLQKIKRFYWKHILWNHTTRLWYFWKYRNSPWKRLYYTKLVQTGKEMRACMDRMREIMAEGEDWESELSDSWRGDK